MTKAVRNVLQLAMELGDDERAMVAERLLGTLQPPGRSLDEPGYREELERRAAELASGEVEGLSWEDVVADVRAALKHSR